MYLILMFNSKFAHFLTKNIKLNKGRWNGKTKQVLDIDSLFTKI